MLKTALKRLRSSQPFNYLATEAAKSVFEATGQRYRFVTRSLPRVGRVRARLPGGESFLLLSRGDETHSSQIFWWGWDAMEPETYPVWYALARKARVTLDVGAYIGEMALVAACANPASRVYAFEPMPGTYERLKEHKMLNGLSNLECFNLGVADQTGTLPIYHEVSDSMSTLETSTSFSLEFAQGDLSPGKRLVKTDVPVVTIDAWAQEHEVRGVDLAKIDTESTEPSVLRGMRRVLGRDKPDLIIECLPEKGEQKLLDEILLPLGYRSRRLLNRTRRQVTINGALNELAGRTGERTHNILYSARSYDLDAMIASADAVSR